VGGGPAGIATALFLSAAAPDLTDRIVVLEKERYPREKPCAGALGARGDAALASIGVTVDVPSVSIDGLAVRALGRTTVVREPKVGRVVRRVEFDAELAAVASRRGIDVRDGVRATALERHDDSVTVRTTNGELRADVVVGADGVSGFVRRALGFGPAPHLAQAIEVDTEPVATDLERDVLLFDLSDRSYPGYYWDFPTLVDGRPMVCRGVYYLKSASTEPIEIEDVLARELAMRGLDLGVYAKRRYAERGFDPRAPVSVPRVLLVGEAAGVDPVTGEGIAQAIQFGSFAGRYLAERIRARDFRFSDSMQRVHGASVGRDLRVRCAALALAYGKRRPAIERFLLDTPDFVRVGLQHFAGRRWSRGSALRAAKNAAWATFAHFLGTDSVSPVRAERLP